MNQDRKVLLHILKNNPRDGEVYITWGGETFVGLIQNIDISAGADQHTKFTIEGFIKQ